MLRGSRRVGVLRAIVLAAAASTLLASGCGDVTSEHAAEPLGSVRAPAGALKPNGTACTAPAECASGFCSDGVCCNSACSGGCYACTALNKADGSPDGSCGPAKVGPPRDNKLCALGVNQECASNQCNGAGTCGKPVGTACGAPACPLPTVEKSGTCGADGVCHDIYTSCDPYACNGGACSKSCSSDAQCAPGNFCRASTCVEPQPNGESCGEDHHCQSLHCFKYGGTAGVCCNEACDSPCFSCFGGHTGDAPGLCRPISSGKDPFGDCSAQPPCGQTGWCGGGQCAIAPPSTTCGLGSTCTVGPNGASVTGQLCDGVGSCVTNQSTTACDPYATCNAAKTQCATTCATSADCIADYFCDADQVCTPKDGIGSACSSADECVSGKCVDGFCCQTDCSGQCEACDVPGSIGSCTPVSGEPHGTRPACPGGDANQPCQERACSGNAGETAECSGFVGNDVLCSKRSCSSGVISEATGCDGQGQCPAPNTIGCGGMVCEGVACKPSCASAEDCVAGWSCDVQSEKCVFSPTCIDETKAALIDGGAEDCGHYQCQSGACRTTCSESAHCQSGRVCDRAAGECKLPAEAAADPGEPSCACRWSGKRRTDLGAWLAIALALLAWRRRA